MSIVSVWFTPAELLAARELGGKSKGDFRGLHDKTVTTDSSITHQTGILGEWTLDDLLGRPRRTKTGFGHDGRLPGGATLEVKTVGIKATTLLKFHPETAKQQRFRSDFAILMKRRSELEVSLEGFCTKPVFVKHSRLHRREGHDLDELHPKHLRRPREFVDLLRDAGVCTEFLVCGDCLAIYPRKLRWAPDQAYPHGCQA